MNNENQNTSPSPLERLTELKNKFETFISTDILNELRTHLSDTLVHAQDSLSKKVDKELKVSLKQTSKFIESQKKELEGFSKKINVLLMKFGAPKKKTAKKAAKKSAPKTTAKKATAKTTAKKTAKKKR